MNILIVGCGRTGAQLADSLFKQGHAVSIIDKNEANFERLSSDFSGMVTQGVPIDVTILEQAGIEQCDAVAAVTSDDNVNAMVAQVAREIFNVERVVARIQDPVRSGVFVGFGFHAICATSLAVFEIENLLLGEGNRLKEVEKTGLLQAKLLVVPVGKEEFNKQMLEQEFKHEGQLVGVRAKDGKVTLLKDAEGRAISKGDQLIFVDVE